MQLNIKLAVAAVLAGLVAAEPAAVLEQRQNSIPPALSTYISEVNGLINSYLLNSQAASVFGSVFQAASITDVTALITGTVYPTSLVAAVPTGYRSGFESFLSVASSLRVSAYGAAGLITTVSGAKATATTTKTTDSTSTTTTDTTVSTTSTSTTSLPSGVKLTTITSSSAVTIVSTGASTTSTGVSTQATTFVSSVSSHGHAAVHTAVVNGAAGLVGLLGIAFAL